MFCSAWASAPLPASPSSLHGCGSSISDNPLRSASHRLTA
jgi:hypothetical protein